MPNETQYIDLNSSVTLPQQVRLVLRLSLPAVLAELSSIAMQYIDAGMVGSLGAEATAAIGLVASTTWLFNGLCNAAAAGFSIQAAQHIGGERLEAARRVLRQALLASLCFGLLLGTAGAALSGDLPRVLGGDAAICPNASRYFLIYACALPFRQFRMTAGSMLQCSGDMRTPSMLNILMCLLDVIFNAVFIFPARRLALGGVEMTVPGAGLGVAGAALGTAAAEIIVTFLLLYTLCFRSPVLRLSLSPDGGWRPDPRCLRTALRLALPLGLERVILCGAQIACTRIVSTLGTSAVAANSLAVTVESLCYMPGFGVAAAATTLVGQSAGAERRDLARRFAYIATALGAALMSCSAALMFLGAPWMFSLLTPDPAIRVLGTRFLRIEAFAEPMFAVSIVAAGALRGTGDTLAPSIMNLVSMWGVRITLVLFLAPRLGLMGVSLAISIELCFRGALFLFRLLRGKWLDHR